MTQKKTSPKKTVPRKTSTKKAAPKTNVAPKSALVTKVASKKAAPKKTTIKRASTKKVTLKNATQQKSQTKKAAPKKVATRTATSAKKQHQPKAPALLGHMRDNFKRSLHTIQKDNERAIKRKRTGKEIAVIVMAIIVVISILLPSFASFVSGNKSQTVTSFSSAQEIYKPKVDELQEKFDQDPTNAEAALSLANEEYRYGTNAIEYASTDDEKSEADAIMQKAVDDFTTYLNLAGSLTTFDEKNAVVTRALCNLYLGDASLATQQLKDLLKETNFAPAWQGLGMLYESQGNNNQAIEAYQNAIAAPQEANQNVTSFCESRLKVLKAENANSSGGAAALNNQLVS